MAMHKERSAGSQRHVFDLAKRDAGDEYVGAQGESNRHFAEDGRCLGAVVSCRVCV
jgi:hypothetical protein